MLTWWQWLVSNSEHQNVKICYTLPRRFVFNLPSCHGLIYLYARKILHQSLWSSAESLWREKKREKKLSSWMNASENATIWSLKALTFFFGISWRTWPRVNHLSFAVYLSHWGRAFPLSMLNKFIKIWNTKKFKANLSYNTIFERWRVYEIKMHSEKKYWIRMNRWCD